MGDEDGDASCLLKTALHACLENGSQGLAFGKDGEWILADSFPETLQALEAASSGCAEGTLQALEARRSPTQSPSLAPTEEEAAPPEAVGEESLESTALLFLETTSPLQEESLDEGTLQAPVQPAELDETTPPQLALTHCVEPTSVEDPSPLDVSPAAPAKRKALTNKAHPRQSYELDGAPAAVPADVPPGPKALTNKAHPRQGEEAPLQLKTPQLSAGHWELAAPVNTTFY